MILLQPLIVGCLTTIAGNFKEIDARVRADLFIPDDAPPPEIIIVDGKTLSKLTGELREFLLASGGGVYDPNTKTIYLDGSAGSSSLPLHLTYSQRRRQYDQNP